MKKPWQRTASRDLRRIETHPDSPTVLNLATLGVSILVALFVLLRPAIAEDVRAGLRAAYGPRRKRSPSSAQITCWDPGSDVVERGYCDFRIGSSIDWRRKSLRKHSGSFTDG